MGAEGRRACPPVHLKCVIGGWDELDKPGETGEAERDNRSDRTKDARMIMDVWTEKGNDSVYAKNTVYLAGQAEFDAF